MAKSQGQKLKLLYIIRMLEEHSDEAHPLSTAQIVERLDAEGIHSERKSIYDDYAKEVAESSQIFEFAEFQMTTSRYVLYQILHCLKPLCIFLYYFHNI